MPLPSLQRRYEQKRREGGWCIGLYFVLWYVWCCLAVSYSLLQHELTPLLSLSLSLSLLPRLSPQVTLDDIQRIFSKAQCEEEQEAVAMVR